MTRRDRATFRQSDLSRALKGAKAAGMDVGRVEIGPDGHIAIIAASTDGSKEPTELDEWEKTHAR